MSKENENKNVAGVEETEEQDTSKDLSFFLPGNAEEPEAFDEVVSKRFKNPKGEPIKWRFKPITTDRVEEIEKNTNKGVKRNGKLVGYETDYPRVFAKVAVESTIYPDLKAAELRKAYKTEDPVEIAKKLLHIAGEYNTWLAISNRANGMTETEEELEEEVKN